MVGAGDRPTHRARSSGSSGAEKSNLLLTSQSTGLGMRGGDKVGGGGGCVCGAGGGGWRGNLQDSSI